MTDYLTEARKKFPISEGFSPSDQSRYVKMKEEAATLLAGRAFSDSASAGSRAVRARMQRAGLNVPTEEMAVTAAEKAYAGRYKEAMAFTKKRATDWDAYVASVKGKQVVKPSTQVGLGNLSGFVPPKPRVGVGIQTPVTPSKVIFGQLGVQPSVSPSLPSSQTQAGLGVQTSFSSTEQFVKQLGVGQLGLMPKEEAQAKYDIKQEMDKQLTAIKAQQESLSTQTYATPNIPANVKGDPRELEELYLIRVPFATAMTTEEQKANLSFEKKLIEQEKTSRLKFFAGNPSASQIADFENSISSWKAQERNVFKQNVSTWKSGEQKRLESEVKEWRETWRPSGVAVQTLAASMQRTEGMPPVLQAIHGAVQTVAQVGSGVIATGESFIYGVGSLIGIKTPTPPPTLTGGLITSGIQSVITGGLTESYEMKQLRDMPLTYTAGTILGDIGLSLGLGYTASKVAGKIVPKSVMAKYQQYVSKPISKAVTKVTKKVTTPVQTWWKGSPVDMYLMGKSKRYATRVASQMSPEVAILGNMDEMATVGAKWQKAKEFSQAALVGDIDLLDTTKAVSKAVQYSQAEDFMWDVLTMTKSGVKMGSTAFITISPYKKGELIARSTEAILPHLVSRAGVVTGIGYLKGTPTSILSDVGMKPEAFSKQLKSFLTMSGKSRGLVQTASLIQITSVAPKLIGYSLSSIASSAPLTISKGVGVGVLGITKMFPQTAPDFLSLKPSSPVLQVTKPHIPQQPLLKPDLLLEQFTPQKPVEPQTPFIPVVFQPLKPDDGDQAVVPYIPIFDKPQKPDVKQKPIHIPKTKPIHPQDQDTPVIPDVIQKPIIKTTPDVPTKPYVPFIMSAVPTVPYFPLRGLPRAYPRGGGRRTKVPSWWEKQEYLYPIRTSKSVASLIFSDLGGGKKKKGKGKKKGKSKSPVSSIVFAKTKTKKPKKDLSSFILGDTKKKATKKKKGKK